MNNPSVRRIMKEIKEMQAEKSTLYTAMPLDDNIFEWHFTVRGPRETDFEGGVYHGKIILPSEYPFKPPDIVFLTPNGRFEVGKKVCLTVSSHHEETWRPSWSLRTVLIAIIAFMPTKGDGAIASLDWPKEERYKLAVKSISWKCDKCGTHNMTALPPEDLQEVADDPEARNIVLKNKEQQERDEKKPLAASTNTLAASNNNILMQSSEITGDSLTLSQQVARLQDSAVIPNDTAHGTNATNTAGAGDNNNAAAAPVTNTNTLDASLNVPAVQPVNVPNTAITTIDHSNVELPQNMQRRDTNKEIVSVLDRVIWVVIALILGLILRKMIVSANMTR
jgi:ubiquitin-conjugating enzyme E2 J1